MKTFSTGDYVRITGDLIDAHRPESFIGMTGTVEFYDARELDYKGEHTEYFVKLENISDVQEEYLDNTEDGFPFFYENELELVD